MKKLLFFALILSWISTLTQSPQTYYEIGVAKQKLCDLNGACLDWSKAGELGFMEAYDLIRQFCN